MKLIELCVGSSIRFNCRLQNHKSGITTKKESCETAIRFNDKCCYSSNSFIILLVQLNEKVHCFDQSCSIKHTLRGRVNISDSDS